MKKLFNYIGAFFKGLVLPIMTFLATSVFYLVAFIVLIQQKHLIINDAAEVGVISSSEVEPQDVTPPLPASFTRKQVEDKLKDFSKTYGGKQ